MFWSWRETYAQDYPVVLLGDFQQFALNRPEEGEPFTIQTLLASETFAPVVPVEALTEPEQFTFPSDRPQYKLGLWLLYAGDAWR
jgi:hypothetical protein